MSSLFELEKRERAKRTESFDTSKHVLRVLLPEVGRERARRGLQGRGRSGPSPRLLPARDVGRASAGPARAGRASGAQLCLSRCVWGAAVGRPGPPGSFAPRKRGLSSCASRFQEKAPSLRTYINTLGSRQILIVQEGAERAGRLPSPGRAGLEGEEAGPRIRCRVADRH